MDTKIFPNYIRAYQYLARVLKTRPKIRGRLDIRHIIITPDRYTLQLEKELMKDLDEQGSFDISVMTFDRLLYNEGVPSKYLSKYGGAMLIRKIIDQNNNGEGQGNFLCFNRALLKGGFPADMHKTITQLKSCLISPQLAVQTPKPHLNNKLKDISYIYQKYEQFLDEYGLQDAGSKLSLLKAQIPRSEYIKNAYFYLFGFDSLTPQAADLIKTLDRYSKGVILTAVSDGLDLYPYIETDSKEPDISNLSEFEKHIHQNLTKRNIIQYHKPAPISVFCANQPATMIRHACQIIAQHIKEGGKFYEIAIVGDVNAKDLAILDEAGISYNYDHKVLLVAHPFVAFIKDCIDAARTHYNNGVAHIAKNFFSGIPYQDACAFENYCLKYNISHNIFEPFELGAQTDECDTAERVRQKLVDILGPFERDLKQSAVTDDYVQAINKFIKDNDLEKRLREYNTNFVTDDFAPYAEQCWDKFAAVLDEFKILSQYKMDIEDFRAVFFAGLEAVEISVIPPIIDAVSVTDIEGIRCGKYKKIIYLNCVEGSFPPLEKDLGLLSDDDLDSLREYDIKIEPKIRQINKRHKFNLIQSFYHGERLYFLYPKRQNGQECAEANLLSVIKKLFPNHDEYSEDSYNTLLSLPSLSQNDIPKVAGYFYSQPSAKKQVLRLYKNALNERQEVLGLGLSSAARALNINFDVQPKKAAFQVALGDTFYATHLENYFCCPYMYLMRHVLKLARRPIGDINSVDIGNILHEILEKFAQYDPKNIEECEQITIQITDQIISENIKLQKNPHFANLLKNEAISATRAVFEQNQKSDFKTIFTEKKFGKGEDLPPLTIQTDTMTAYIGGKIDRIDQYQDYIKIIDYKSGKVKSSAEELYAGINLQIMLYMKACSQALGKKPFASLYFPINNDFMDEKKHSRYRNIGLVACEPEALLAADKTLYQTKKSNVLPIAVKTITPDAVVAAARQSCALELDEFENILEYSVNLTKTAIDELASGYFEPHPYEDVCNWCDYRGICCEPYQNQREFDQLDITNKTIASLGQKD